MCKRCGADVVRVYTREPGYNVDIDVTPTRSTQATAPLFRRLVDDTFVQVHSLTDTGGIAGIPAGATHAAHHCSPPARCRLCEQTHQSSGDLAGGNSSTLERTAP